MVLANNLILNLAGEGGRCSCGVSRVWFSGVFSCIVHEWQGCGWCLIARLGMLGPNVLANRYLSFFARTCVAWQSWDTCTEQTFATLSSRAANHAKSECHRLCPKRFPQNVPQKLKRFYKNTNRFGARFGARWFSGGGGFWGALWGASWGAHLGVFWGAHLGAHILGRFFGARAVGCNSKGRAWKGCFVTQSECSSNMSYVWAALLHPLFEYLEGSLWGICAFCFAGLERKRFASQYLKQLKSRRWHFNWVVLFNFVAENQSIKMSGGAQILGHVALQGGPPWKLQQLLGVAQLCCSFDRTSQTATHPVQNWSMEMPQEPSSRPQPQYWNSICGPMRARCMCVYIYIYIIHMSLGA